MAIDSEQIQRAIALIKKGSVNADYFFEQLKSPLWIEPLAKNKLFSKPYGAVRQGDAVSFPFWAPGQYLARMAAVPEAQSQVFEILRELPPSDNPRVYDVVADAAAALPPDMANQLTHQLLRGIELPFQLLLPEKVATVIVRLADGGLDRGALRLTRSLLAVLPPTRKEGDGDDVAIRWGRTDAKSRMDDWHYNRVVEHILTSLVRSAGRNAFGLFSDLLEQAVAVGRDQTAEGPEDSSYSWRSSVEHSDERRENIRDILVSAVRDSASQLIASSPENLPVVVEALLERPTKIFHRIALFQLIKHGELGLDLVRTALRDISQWEDVGLHPEFELLLAGFFNELAPDSQQRVLNWIEKGPDVDRYIEFRKRWDEHEPDAQEIQRHRDIWERDHLGIIADSVPLPYKERFESLVAAMGPPPPIGRPLFTVSAAARGERSPLSDEDTLSLDWTSLVSALRTWSPRLHDFDGPSIAGLAGSLRQRVTANPGEAVENLNKVTDVRPQYITAILEALRDAIKKKEIVNWEPLLIFLARVLEEAHGLHNGDDDWRWVSKCVASLVDDSFDAGQASIPITLRDVVWAIIERLSQNQDPTPEHEERYGGSNMDPATLSLNTVRGETFHAVMRYSLWWRRHLESLPEATERIKRGFDELPEVRTVLDRHLDTSIEPSLAVRAVYGQWFPWLVLMDPAWAGSRAVTIFPPEPAQSRFFWAAWGTYVVFCPAYTNVLPILRSQYVMAVGSLPEGMTVEVGMRERPSERLADHLVAYYWRGDITLSENDLVTQFFNSAEPKLRGHALESVGRALHQIEEDPSGDVSQRLVALWEWRMNHKPLASEELASFGWWFGSGRIDQAWSLRVLKELLTLGVLPEPDHLVVKRLAAIAEAYPMPAIESLDRMIDLASQDWTIHGWIDDARELLAIGLRSSNADVRARAERVVHRLGALRFRDFRTLLKA